ncbi:MAG: polysaccharide deacetylase family protein [Thermodesulfobacteriota bacterium]|nr:polysaccharide deacetylase family protein [Thermodesulfobacteriota bacterium]
MVTLNTYKKQRLNHRAKKTLKKSLLRIPGVFQSACLMTKTMNPRVLVYHRFCDRPDTEKLKIDSQTFENQLLTIKKHFKIVTLAEILKQKRLKKPLPDNSAVLTVDDGYLDFYTIAYPLLKKHNVKATLFPVVNFVDQKIWLWPDRILYAFENTSQTNCVIAFKRWRFDIDLTSSQGTASAFERIINVAIAIDNHQKWELLDAVADQLQVDIPGLPTAKYAPVSWDQLREMNQNGIEIGSHTMNHPILSRIDKNEIEAEIFLSKAVLTKKLNNEIVSFCYPNSFPGDINDQVVEAVKRAGYWGAVFYLPPGDEDMFKIPRIPADQDMVNFNWHLCGMAYLHAIRGFKKQNHPTDYQN